MSEIVIVQTVKRDMDLIRLLLLQVEGNEAATGEIVEKYSEAAFGPNAGEYVAHQCALLIDAGYVVGETVYDASKGYIVGAVMQRLTWAGHEFLDTIREDRVWIATKEKVLKPGASWTISFLVEVAKAEIRKHLGLP